MKSRALSDPHASIATPEEGERDPVIGLDYGFMGADDDKAMPILMAKETGGKSWWAATVQRKGAVESAINTTVSWIEELGYSTIECKSDNEPALMALKEEVIKRLKRKGSM